MPMFHASARSSGSSAAGECGRLVEHALELVAGRALEAESGRHGAEHLERGRDLVGLGLAAVLVHGEHHDAHARSLP